MNRMIPLIVGVACAVSGCAGDADGLSDDLPDTEPATQLGESNQPLVLANTCVEPIDGNNFEVNANLGANSVVTAVGARINANEDVTTIRLEGKFHDANGTLHPGTLSYYGGEPTLTPEVWCTAPVGHIVTGIAASADGNHSVSAIALYTRLYDPASGRLVGGEVLKRCGPEGNGHLERHVVASEHVDGQFLDRAVVTGVSMGARGSGINGLRAKICLLQ